MFNTNLTADDPVDVLVEKIRARVHSLIERRFGCGMRVLSPDEAQSIAMDIKDKALRHGYGLSNSSLLVPLISDQGVSGWMMTTGPVPESEFDRMQICSLIDLSSVQIQRVQGQAHTLRRIERLLTTDKLPTNVIRLPRRSDIHKIPATNKLPMIRETKASLQVSCLIEGVDASEIFKMALELHQLSGRSHFVQWQDIFVYKPQDLLGLHSVTLYVPSIELLNFSQINPLIQLLSNPERPTSVQVIVGTLVRSSELRERGSELRRLLDTLSGCHLVMQKTFNEYRELGLFQYLHSALVNDFSGRTLS